MTFKLDNTKFRECKNCGVRFVPLTPHQQYCKKECNHQYNLKVRRERYLQPLKKIENCLQCGKPLKPYGSQKYCSNECKVEHRKQIRRKTERICNKVIEPKVLKKCLNCGEDIPWNRNYASIYFKKKFCSKKCSNNYFKLHKNDFKGSQRNKGEFKIIINKVLDKFVWEAKKDNKTVLKCDKSFDTYKECVKDVEMAF